MHLFVQPALEKIRGYPETQGENACRPRNNFWSSNVSTLSIPDTRKASGIQG